MDLREILADLHALEEERLSFVRKDGIRAEIFDADGQAKKR